MCIAGEVQMQRLQSGPILLFRLCDLIDVIAFVSFNCVVLTTSLCCPPGYQHQRYCTGQRKDWALHKSSCLQAARIRKRHQASAGVSVSHQRAEPGIPSRATLYAVPDEVLLEIFRRLSPTELVQCACTCHRWNQLTSSASVWHEVCVQQGLLADSPGIRALRQSRSSVRHTVQPPTPEIEDYKSLYSSAVGRKTRWETGTYAETTLTGHGHNVECLQFVQSVVLGDVLVSSSWDHDVRVWCCSTKECVRHLVGHTGWVTCMLTGGGWVVSGGVDHRLCAWRYEEAAAHSPSVTLQHQAAVTACCWLSQRTGLIVSGCTTGALYIWNIWSGERVCALDAAHEAVWSLRSLCGPEALGAARFVVTAGSRDGHGRVFCGTVKADGAVVNEKSRDGSAAPTHVLSGHRMALLCMDLTWLRVSDMWGHAGLVRGAAPDTIAAAPSMACVALGSADSTVSVWEAMSGRRLSLLGGQHKVGVLSIQFHRLGRRVDRHATPAEQAHDDGLEGRAPQLLLLSGGADHAVCLWDVMGSACLQRLPSHTGPVTSVRALGEVVVTIAEGDCTLVYMLQKEQSDWKHALGQSSEGSRATEVRMVLHYSVHRASPFAVSSAVTLTHRSLAVGGQHGDISMLEF